MLEIKVGIVAARGKRFAQIALQVGFGDAVALEVTRIADGMSAHGCFQNLI